MKNYAVIEDGVVVNLIVAESLEVAESLTEQTCIEYNSSDKPPFVGLGWDGTEFEQPVEGEN
jgi:hypothetical protein